jgi:hypothetical protein
MIALVPLGAVAQAPPVCSGPSCEGVVISIENGCVVVNNNRSSPVGFMMGSTIGTLKSRERWRAVDSNGRCLTGLTKLETM